MSLGELVDAWEEPMPDLVRAWLQTELQARNYRVQSLPEPPPSATHTSLQPLSRTEQVLPHAVQGVAWVLSIAILQLLTGALLAWDVIEEPPWYLPVSHIMGAASSSGLGVAFLGLFCWARYDAYSALLAALTLFVAIHGIEAGRVGLSPGLGGNLIILFYLASGTWGAAKLRSVKGEG